MKTWQADPVYEERAAKRFHAKYEVLENGCWRWLSAIDPHGYGTFHFRGRCRRAHQSAYLICKGDIPKGLHVDHLCGNRWCVNPDHLEAVTPAENARRGRRSKLNPDAAQVIREEIGPWLKYFMKKYGVSSQAVIACALGDSWQ